ncbi:MAG: fumarylacetoacetate hydrolase family protein [Caldilineaceae bacterium]
MKLVTFVHNDKTAVGALSGAENELVVDLSVATPSLPANLKDLLAAGASALEEVAAAVRNPPYGSTLNLEEVKLLAPIPNPGKILCIGLNYRDHAAESNSPLPPHPIVFAKYSNAVLAPGDPIVLPKNSQQPDYEAEFGVVIGKRARHVSEADALSYVGGYLPFHDVSARDYQMRTSQWSMGKTFDTFAPFGPALTTADEIPDPQTLDIQLSINGEVLQKSNTKNLIFTVQQLIADLTSVMTLEPGDIIATGTPGGVGSARKPPRWLKAGDVVRIEIEKLGVLENPCVNE